VGIAVLLAATAPGSAAWAADAPPPPQLECHDVLDVTNTCAANGALGAPDQGGVVTDPTYVPELPDAGSLATKTSVEAATAPDSARLLQAGALAAAPDPADVVTYPRCADCSGSRDQPPASAKIYTGSNKQEQPTWCVPATASNALAAFGLNVNQSTLAAEMRTTNVAGGGTDPRRLVNALNSRQHQFGYVYAVADSVGGAAGLFNKTVVDIYRYRAPEGLTVELRGVGYYHDSRIHGIHEMEVRGYSNAAGGTLIIFDPLADQRSGEHNFAASDGFNAMQMSGNGLVW